MRELTTIGNLASLRTMRAIERSSRLMPMRMGWIGASAPAPYVQPALAELDAVPPSAYLTAATRTMLAHFASDGVPTADTPDAVVLTFQKAYNAEPAEWVRLGSKLPEDGGYGADTYQAADFLVNYTGGGSPPIPVIVIHGDVTPTPKPSPKKPTPTTPPAPADSHAVLWILAIVAAVGAAYAASRMMKRRRARRRAPALPSRAIVLT